MCVYRCQYTSVGGHGDKGVRVCVCVCVCVRVRERTCSGVYLSGAGFTVLYVRVCVYTSVWLIAWENMVLWLHETAGVRAN